MQFLIFFAAVFTASLAQAQEVSCTCRFQGEDYGLGESICIKGSNGMQMATCSMVLNNTSWQMSNAPCPLSSAPALKSREKAAQYTALPRALTTSGIKQDDALPEMIASSAATAPSSTSIKN